MPAALFIVMRLAARTPARPSGQRRAGLPFEADILAEASSRSPCRCRSHHRHRPGRWPLGSSCDEPVPMLPDDEPGRGLTSIWADGIQIAPLAGA
jgi:hypothetical protein